MPPTSKKHYNTAKLLPKHQEYLDAFQKFVFLKGEHLQYLFGHAVNKRTLRWDMMRLVDGGYLCRVRSSKDEEYTYFPANIREKSTLTLVHTNEVTWAQIRVCVDAPLQEIQILTCERHSPRIKFAACVPDDEGRMKPRSCVPDFFFALQRIHTAAGQGARPYFWEITNAKPGQHWKKENDIIQKCEMYNAWFDSGKFVDRLQKEFDLNASNFRVVITFPTEARARNFVQIFNSRRIAYQGRFWITWKDAYHTNMYGPIFLCPKDDRLHSFHE